MASINASFNPSLSQHKTCLSQQIPVQYKTNNSLLPPGTTFVDNIMDHKSTSQPPLENQEIQDADMQDVDEHATISDTTSRRPSNAAQLPPLEELSKPPSTFENRKKPSPNKRKPSRRQSVDISDDNSSTNEVHSSPRYGAGDEIYCICRKPDGGRWMIACDYCDNWFHGSCINISQSEGDLVDRYFCPTCVEAGRGSTTWKRKCRLFSCRSPAFLPSKYCTQKHGVEFFALQVRKSTHSPPEISALVNNVSSVEEFRRLGDSVPPPPESSESGDAYHYPDELGRLSTIAAEREQVYLRTKVIEKRSDYLALSITHAKRVNDEIRQSEPSKKDICGFNYRLAWDDVDWDEWFEIPESAQVFESGRLVDRDGMCLLEKKKCARHQTWQTIKREEIDLEAVICRDVLAKLRREEKEIRERQDRRATARAQGVGREGRVLVVQTIFN
ncbi:Set1 complex component spp1 [Neolecta irregularis DAH-3]|uniref:CXXC-type zinc finger protein 1 n=1 Tax=Neolecta irregularis (strain DAH-3) TaxID=1198029 RepID=A0A1U7LU54_NEOID|nr:Set1 complex component spp1 [Neolecta irregularis DAH-3]|eukprot:OLL26148.1 Set1 complex component spp1 [Neolecta irregularis DAH-3]